MNTREDTYVSWANVAPIRHQIQLLSLESALDWRDKLLSVPLGEDGVAEKKEMILLLDSHIHLLKQKNERKD